MISMQFERLCVLMSITCKKPPESMLSINMLAPSCQCVPVSSEIAVQPGTDLKVPSRPQHKEVWWSDQAWIRPP